MPGTDGRIETSNSNSPFENIIQKYLAPGLVFFSAFDCRAILIRIALLWSSNDFDCRALFLKTQRYIFNEFKAGNTSEPLDELLSIRKLKLSMTSSEKVEYG